MERENSDLGDIFFVCNNMKEQERNVFLFVTIWKNTISIHHCGTDISFCPSRIRLDTSN